MSNRLLPPFMAFFDANGDPLSGGKLEWFESGTSTNLDTYSEAALSTALANPIILNSAGRPDTDVFGNDQNYKLTVSDSADVLIATFDPVRGVVRAKGADIASATTLVIGLDGNYFDVTGTTGFSAMTVTAGTLFMLQFDGALTMTDGASLDLGGADITTAAGDRGLFFATAADTVQLMGWITEGNARTAPVSGTEQASTSGTEIDFTSIPSWAKIIIIQFRSVSTTGTSRPIIQLGDSGGIETSGYNASVAELTDAGGVLADTPTDGFPLSDAWGNTRFLHGTVTLSLKNSTDFSWVASGVVAATTAPQVVVTCGGKLLSAALDRVRITTTGGSDTFDNGVINILYE